MTEELDPRPDCDVPDREFFRLLGYPRRHAPSDRALELAAWARGWFAEHGRPWIYVREVALSGLAPQLDSAADLFPGSARVPRAGGGVPPAPSEVLGETPRTARGTRALPGKNSLLLDGIEFESPQLREHLARAGAVRAMLVAVSAGRAAEEHARELWEGGKPDEYFFLEVFASAVVERIVATASGRLCELAERDGLIAVPHYSPGYTGWDIADQVALFEMIARGGRVAFPEKLEVLSSGMLRPKKSQLAVVGLAPRTARGLAAARATPCRSCSFTPCGYRRAPYRHAVEAAAAEIPASPP